MRLVISARKSDLARIQAQTVGDALKNNNIEVEYRFRESLGDKNLADPLWKMPEKGVFTQDFLVDLISGQTDVVVHSWKDLPVEDRSNTKIVATLPRGDQRDLLLVRKDRWLRVKESKKLNILSSSPRRAYNLGPFLKAALPSEVSEINFESVRGNVPTRIQKLLTSQIDGLVVAKAALDRLLTAKNSEFALMQDFLKRALEQFLVMILPLEQNPTAAAQGALAIEINSAREDLDVLFKSISCQKTLSAVSEERQILKGYGGGCHQKVGVSVRSFSFGKLSCVKALTDQGEVVNRFDFAPRDKIQKAPIENIFPETADSSRWFKREFFNVELPEGPLWISKAEALPATANVDLNRLVWASGWETWKRLAKRGVWISGCSESLGEDSGLEKFSFWGNPIWTKLTHSDSPTQEMKSFATYKLIPLDSHPNLEGKTHFYWMSGSSFRRALELNPILKTAHHSCGPGNSFSTISKYVDVSVFPNYEIWKDHVLL